MSRPSDASSRTHRTAMYSLVSRSAATAEEVGIGCMPDSPEEVLAATVVIDDRNSAGRTPGRLI